MRRPVLPVAPKIRIEEALGAVENAQGLQAAYSELLDQYYEIVFATPAMRDIWSGMQADKQQESRIVGGLLADAMLRVFPDRDALRVRESAFLIWHLGEATMRLAIACAPEEGRGLVEAFKRMSLLEIMAPAAGSSEFDSAADALSAKRKADR
ncbi:hypothetical protein [Pseudomonas fluorescens]|uniref:hypothetical protein n=1 Tax=Pseudomonas fluorescens TaxID=294 RepID=UPI001CD776EE|nr:hypothetical protein [Pseudomonas fluorescens]